MDMLGRRESLVGIGGLLFCVGLALPACGTSARNFGTDDGGTGGQGTGGDGESGTRAVAGNAGASAGSSHGGNAAGGNPSEAGTGGNGGDGGRGAASSGTGGLAQGGAAQGGSPQGGAAQAGSGGAVAKGGGGGVLNGGSGGVAGSVGYCGDNAVRSGYETCDDGNAVTESCTYGLASCTVCDATCHSVPGGISYCGDSVRQSAHEACDNGAANSTNGNCSPTCTTCDKVPGTEPVTYDDTSWTGGVSFTVTKATTLYQFKVYHNDSSYQLNLYQLTAADTAPAADATPVWKMPVTAPKASTFDTIDVSLPLSAGTSYVLTTVGQVMAISVPNPAVAFPVQSLSGIKVTKSFSVGDTLELNQGSFSTSHWGPFTDLRSCLQSPN